MIKTLGAAATLCALAATAHAQAPSGVTLYGTLDVGLRRVSNTGAGSVWTQATGNTNSSQFGIRGNEDLGGGLRARFNLEADLFPDTGLAGNASNANPVPPGQFWSRMSWVGLQHAQLGEVRLGRDYSPAFLNVAVYDPFGYIGVGSVSNMLNSAQTVAISAAFGPSVAVSANTTVRANNAVSYASPPMGGFFVHAMLAPAEGAASTGNTGNSKFNSLRLGYAAGPVNVSVAYADTANTLVAGAHFKQAVVGGSYDFGVLRLSAVVNRFKYIDAESRMQLLALQAPLGGGVLKASMARVDQSGSSTAGVSIADRDASQLALGYVHDLSKRTAVYGQAARVANKGASMGITIAGGPALVAGSDRKSTAFEFGLRHFF